MKKLILIYIALLPISNQAQITDNNPWCPPGATWVYSRLTQGLYYTVYSYVGDEVIQGFNCKNIEVKEVYFVTGMQGDIVSRTEEILGNVKLRESNDSVFILYQNEFRLMYNFSADINDTFIVNKYFDYSSCSDNSPELYVDDTLKVINSYSQTFDNITFDLLNISSHGRWDFGSIINKIGGLRSFVPSPSQNNCVSDLGYIELCCYSDDLRGNILFNENNNNILNCHYITTFLLENDGGFQGIKIFPNPAYSILNIEIANQNNLIYTIVDISGKTISHNISMKTDSIDISNLNSGVYFIILSNNYNSHTIKFIKE